MRHSLIFLFIIASLVDSFSQSGIGTATPDATLHIEGNPNNPSSLDGVLPPRITGDQLRAKTYTSDQNGAIVFVTNPPAIQSGQVALIAAKGIHVFDGETLSWRPTTSPRNRFATTTRKTVYWTGNTPSLRTSLPADANLIELENAIQLNIRSNGIVNYFPVIINISGAPIDITYHTIAPQSFDRTREVERTLLAGESEALNHAVRWTTLQSDVITADILLPSGTWYELQWFAFTKGLQKHVYMTAQKKR